MSAVSEWDCTHRGHIWLEADGAVFYRVRRTGSTTPHPVHCKHCNATATLVGWGDKRPEAVAS